MIAASRAVHGESGRAEVGLRESFASTSRPSTRVTLDEWGRRRRRRRHVRPLLVDGRPLAPAAAEHLSRQARNPNVIFLFGLIQWYSRFVVSATVSPRAPSRARGHGSFINPARGFPPPRKQESYPNTPLRFLERSILESSAQDVSYAPITQSETES